MNATLSPCQHDLLGQIRDRTALYPVDGNAQRTFDALERKGLVHKTQHGDYYITDRGRSLLDELEGEDK